MSSSVITGLYTQLVDWPSGRDGAAAGAGAGRGLAAGFAGSRGGDGAATTGAGRGCALGSGAFGSLLGSGFGATCGGSGCFASGLGAGGGGAAGAGEAAASVRGGSVYPCSAEAGGPAVAPRTSENGKKRSMIRAATITSIFAGGPLKVTTKSSSTSRRSGSTCHDSIASGLPSAP